MRDTGADDYDSDELDFGLYETDPLEGLKRKIILRINI